MLLSNRSIAVQSLSVSILFPQIYCNVLILIFVSSSFRLLYLSDSANSTFIQGLNRRVKIASGDLNLLESMSFATVSFEELLGHCNEVYKNNQTHLLELQDRLKDFNYVPGILFLVSPLFSDLLIYL